jgi:hypothetical protein
MRSWPAVFTPIDPISMEPVEVVRYSDYQALHQQLVEARQRADVWLFLPAVFGIVLLAIGAGMAR